MLTKKYFLTIFSFFLLTLGFTSQAANVIFDLGGVIFTTRKMKAVKNIGILNLIRYGGDPTRFFFSYLHSIKRRTPETPQARDEHGNLLPQLMCDWMDGALTGKQIAHEVYNRIDKDHCLSKAEYTILENLTEMIFEKEENLAETQRLIKDGLRFAHRCKKEGHKLYIISNWNAESFRLVEKAFPELFNLFDGAIISGDVGLIKPDPAIYHKCLTDFGLKAEESVFIDDQIENIKAAEKLGIKGIHCRNKKVLFGTKPDYRHVNKQFDLWQDVQLA